MSAKPPARLDLRGTPDCAAPANASVAARVAALPGSPLPETARADAEARFGRSFADVRVHDGGEASRLAAAAHARAFTLGRHVVFGRDQWATAQRDGLLQHELAHVAAPAPTTMLQRAPLFDTSDLQFRAPPEGLTAADIKKQLDGKVKKSPPDITSYTVKGVKPTDEAFIFLATAIFEFGTPARRDSVMRLEMETGWPPKGSGAVTPTGLVTLSIDASGNATAELVSPVVTAVSPSLSSADAVTKLKTNYGVDAVAGSKAWAPSELGDVVQAFGLLPAGDRAALKGVQLERMTTLPRSRSGEFTAGGGVSMGATTVTALPTLRLADSAFPKSRFAMGPVGGPFLPGSERTILHEVGHAVEEALMRAKLEAADTAVIRQNVASHNLDATLAKWKKAAPGSAEATAAAAEYKTRKATYDTAKSAATTAKGALTATRVSGTVIKPLETELAAKKKAYATERKTADSSAAGYSPADTTASLAYRSTIDDVAKLLDDYEKKAQPGTDLDPLDDALLAAVAARKQARADLAKSAGSNPALPDYAAVDTAQDAWVDAARALGHMRGRTKRLQKFVDLVNASSIVPLTAYARANWPFKPEEFYAETYSLWLTEPVFLNASYPVLFDFFDKGDYLK
jgi:hypothetical protein